MDSSVIAAVKSSRSSLSSSPDSLMVEATKTERRSRQTSERGDAGSPPDYAAKYTERGGLANNEFARKGSVKRDTVLRESKEKKVAFLLTSSLESSPASGEQI